MKLKHKIFLEYRITYGIIFGHPIQSIEYPLDVVTLNSSQFCQFKLLDNYINQNNNSRKIFLIIELSLVV